MSTPQLVSYEQTDGIATLTMDDGKANVMSFNMLTALLAAFDRAEQDAAVKVMVLTPDAKAFFPVASTSPCSKARSTTWCARCVRATRSCIAC